MAVPLPAPERLKLVIFRVDEVRHAVPVSSVERVVAAAQVTPVPGAASIIVGAVDIAGQIVPVFCLRRLLQRPARDLRATDCFMLVRTPRRLLALLVDEVEGIDALETPAPLAADAASSLRGALGLEDSRGDSLLFIHDAEGFLSPQDERLVAHGLGQLA